MWYISHICDIHIIIENKQSKYNQKKLQTDRSLEHTEYTRNLLD